MNAANPYLNFDGNTEEAFTFYKSVFGGEFLTVLRFRDFDDNSMGVPERDLDKIAHISLPLGTDNVLMATDVLQSMPMTLTVGNNFYIHVEPENETEAETLFSALSAGGRIEMALQKTPWAEKYGTCADRFGVQWMVNYTGGVQFAGG
jgi:PhnB protein